MGSGRLYCRERAAAASLAWSREGEEHDMEHRKPLHVVRHGRVRAAIWQNTSRCGFYLSATFQLNYRDGGTYKTSSSFNEVDLTELLRTVADVIAFVELDKGPGAQCGRPTGRWSQSPTRRLP